MCYDIVNIKWIITKTLKFIYFDLLVNYDKLIKNSKNFKMNYFATISGDRNNNILFGYCIYCLLNLKMANSSHLANWINCVILEDNLNKWEFLKILILNFFLNKRNLCFTYESNAKIKMGFCSQTSFFLATTYFASIFWRNFLFAFENLSFWFREPFFPLSRTFLFAFENHSLFDSMVE